MGTSNFLYNHKLDVISGTLFSTFDLEAYNKEMDEEDRLKADDNEAIGNILHLNSENAVEAIRYRADEPDRERDPWRKHRIDGFRILSTTDAREDNGEYMTHNFGGTRIATLTAETLFWGVNICMELDVILRCGYYDGSNIDQEFRIYTEYSNYRILEGCEMSSFDEAIDYVITELEDADIATYQQLCTHRKGINRRLCALEQVLWERYEELISPWCEQYQVFARFSNGETWYSKKAA